MTTPVPDRAPAAFANAVAARCEAEAGFLPLSVRHGAAAAAWGVVKRWLRSTSQPARVEVVVVLDLVDELPGAMEPVDVARCFVQDLDHFVDEWWIRNGDLLEGAVPAIVCELVPEPSS